MTKENIESPKNYVYKYFADAIPKNYDQLVRNMFPNKETLAALTSASRIANTANMKWNSYRNLILFTLFYISFSVHYYYLYVHQF